MRKFYNILILLLTVGSFLFSEPLNPQPIRGKVLEVRYTSADIKESSVFKITKDNKFMSLQPQDTIESGDTIITNKSLVSIFIQPFFIGLQPSTSLQLAISYIRDNRTPVMIWNLQQGLIYVETRIEYDQSKLIFRTKTGNTLIVSNADFEIDEKGLVSVFRGEVHLFNRYLKDEVLLSDRLSFHAKLTTIPTGYTGNGRMENIRCIPCLSRTIWRDIRKNTEPNSSSNKKTRNNQMLGILPKNTYFKEDLED